MSHCSKHNNYKQTSCAVQHKNIALNAQESIQPLLTDISHYCTHNYKHTCCAVKPKKTRSKQTHCTDKRMTNVNNHVTLFNTQQLQTNKLHCSTQKHSQQCDMSGYSCRGFSIATLRPVKHTTITKRYVGLLNTQQL